jgi:putative flippase GtrA
VRLSPTGLIELSRTPDGKKMLRYTMVSIVSVVVSEMALALMFGVVGWSARWSNVLATAVGTIPSYQLNRKWAWGKKGKGHLWKEVVPFWSLSFVGLAFSTWSADFAESVVKSHGFSHGTQTIAIVGAALAAWGVLWIGKFIFFNKVLFRTHPQDLDPALDGRTGLPT